MKNTKNIKFVEQSTLINIKICNFSKNMDNLISRIIKNEITVHVIDNYERILKKDEGFGIIRFNFAKRVSHFLSCRGRSACSRPESTHHSDGILFAVPFTGLTQSGLHYRNRNIIPS